MKIFLNTKQIETVVRKIAEEITADLENENPLFLVVLEGAKQFANDLLKQIGFPHQVEYIKAESYHDKKISSGKVKIKVPDDLDLEGKNIVVIEDIIDTGFTCYQLTQLLLGKRPASLRIATLLDKKVKRIKELTVDYRGIEIPDIFVVGYGLDFDGKYRELGYIGQIE